MKLGEVSLDDVRRVADAVLYEGYILYPYRASAAKNRSRWQFGVLMPPGYVAAEPSERATAKAECVFEHSGRPEAEILVRFLQVRRRTVTTGSPPSGAAPVTSAQAAALPVPAPVWDEAVEQEVPLTVDAAALTGPGMVTRFTIPGGSAHEVRPGSRVVRQREGLEGSITVRARPLPGPWRAARLTVEVSNETAASSQASASPRTPAITGPAERQTALPRAMVAVHMIIALSGGAFISMTDPPRWASEEVAACQNIGCWPVLAGPAGSRRVMLAAPIILPDYPEVAPESPGELYDGTEIDEILTLRTLALSEREKAEARATDPRAAALIDRVDAMDTAAMERLHGTIRSLTVAGGPAVPGDLTVPGQLAGEDVPWWDPGADASVSPGTDAVVVAGHRVASGSRVVLRPGVRRADAQDMFLAGRTAVVEAVLTDVDGSTYLAVSLAGDPAADLRSAHGRFLYFAPDEVEPCDGDPGGPGDPGPEGTGR